MDAAPPREERKARSRSKEKERRKSPDSRRNDRRGGHGRERRSRSRSRSRDRDRERRRSPGRDRYRDGGSRGHEREREVKQRSPSPEVSAADREIDDLTKDQRTVFVSQLVMKADERAVRNFFEKVGKVKQVIMIRDKYTNRHKGFCYVEMKELDSIPLVLMLHNAVPDFQKFPILIKASEAEKNFLKKQETTIAAAAAETARKDRLFVSNLHPSLGEDDLVTVLGAFGRILKVTLNKDPVTGASLGAGIVKFEQEEDAAVALGKIQGEGLELMGSALQVMYYSEPTAPAIPQQGAWNMDQGNNGGSLDAAGRLALMQRLGGGAAATPLPGMPPPMGLQHCNPGMGMPPQGIMPGMGFPQGLQGVAPPPPMAPMGRGQSNLPAWMTQGGIQPAAAPGAAAAVPAPAPAVPPVRAVIGSPSITVLIRNMFDPATETEPEWDVDITEDTTEECSRFGEVKHCYVEPKEPGGLVYLCFGTLASAAGAAAHLNGRWFAGRTITVEYLDPQVYMAKCPDAAAVVAASLQNA